MIETDLSELERLFLALNDKTRLRLLALMKDGPVVVGFLADRLNESQPKISRHLAYMRNAGIVHTQRDGKWIYYGISYPENTFLRQILEMVVETLVDHDADGIDGAFSGDAVLGNHDDNIYAQADIVENTLTEAYISEEIAEIVGPIDDEMFYGSDAEPEEMDVFLL
jgi:ArsR family transcriptional regulator